MLMRPVRLLVLKKREGLERAFARLASGPLAVDTETTGLRWWEDRVGALNLAAGTTAVVALGDALGPAVRWLADEVKKRRELVFHHAKFDLHMLRGTFGLHVPYLVHDTKVESFVVDNRGAWYYLGENKDSPHSLKPLASVYVDPDAPDHERELLSAIRRHGGRHKGDWFVLLGTEDEKLFTDYSALDAWYTLRLHQLFIERIQHWVQPAPDDGEHPYPSLRSVYERERWLILAFRDMEERGIIASRPFLEEWREKLAEQLKKDREELWRLAGKREINWNSWQQLQQLLYHDLKIRSESTGTDAVTLLRLRHPLGAAIVRYRETYKQWSSYANSLLEAIAPDGAIHPTFKSTGARTGRTSCEEPNLQQQTRVSGVREAYQPRKGLVFRMADYSQVEMRYAAHFAREPSLIKGFNENPDFDTHESTAKQMFGRLYDPTTQHRKFGKIINFTKLFGGGEDKITEQLINLVSETEARAGCKQLKVTRDPTLSPWRQLAREIIRRFNESMPSMTRAIRREADVAEQRGFVMTAFGSHRYLDDDRWYAAFNTKVQGTAGIKAKEGLVNVYRECQLNRGELGLQLLIHDEIFYESEGDPRTDRRVLELMQDLTSYRVPIIADMSGSAKSWQAKTKIKL